MTGHSGARILLATLAIVLSAVGAGAAQVTVGIGAQVPADCKAGSGAATIDVPIVIWTDESGAPSVQVPAVSVPGVICNSRAVVTAASRGLGAHAQGVSPGAPLKVGYSADVRFGGATAHLDTAANGAAMAQTGAAALGRLTIVLTAMPTHAPLPAGATFTDTLRITLAPR